MLQEQPEASNLEAPPVVPSTATSREKRKRKKEKERVRANPSSREERASGAEAARPQNTKKLNFCPKHLLPFGIKQKKRRAYACGPYSFASS